MPTALIQPLHRAASPPRCLPLDLGTYGKCKLAQLCGEKLTRYLERDVFYSNCTVAMLTEYEHRERKFTHVRLPTRSLQRGDSLVLPRPRATPWRDTHSTPTAARNIIGFLICPNMMGAAARDYAPALRQNY